MVGPFRTAISDIHRIPTSSFITELEVSGENSFARFIIVLLRLDWQLFTTLEKVYAYLIIRTNSGSRDLLDLVFAWKETTIGQDTDDIVKNSLFILIRISDKLYALSLIESKKNLVSLKAVFDQRFICGVSKYFSERCCSYL